MKKALVITVGIAILFFTACMNAKAPKTKADITTDTLHYTYQNIKERDGNCGDKPDSGCTVAQIKYPVFANADVLNDTVTSKLANLMLPGVRFAGTLQTQAKNFIDDYFKFKKHLKNYNKPFSLSSYAKTLRQDSNLVTIEYGGHCFSGGAHGASLVLFLNWNTKTQKEITLEDLLIPNYKDQLTAVAEKVFRKQENLKDTSSLTRDYFFKSGKFYLNNNFLISPVGLRFLYNEYEIKPYAAGTTDIFIPYTQIKTLLKPHTVISQYIK